jgi:cytochrome P450
MEKAKVSFLDPKVLRCPFSAYAAVGKDNPVYYDESCGYYIVTGYDEVRKWSTDSKNLSNVTGLLLVKDAPYQPKIDAIYQEQGFLPLNTLTVSDPPLHTFHRSLVDKAFTVGRVKQMEDYLQSIVDGMIDNFIARGECDFYSEFAARVPIQVIASQLGVEISDIDQFKEWSDAVINESNPNNTEEEQKQITRTICELQQFIATKARQFQKTPEDCLLSDLVHADDNGRKMSTRELVSIVLILLVAGNDSTALAMTSAMHRIVTIQGLEDTLRANPARIPNFLEEVLRLEAPVQGLYRRVLHDIRIGETDIPAGAIIVLRFGAANRDPAQFPHPDAFELDRNNVRSHLTFGAGPHFCVGNQLSRGELRIAFSTLMRRMRNFRLKDGTDAIDWMEHFLVYGPCKLQITFHAL